MTFHFTQMHFMFGLLTPDKTSAEAASKIRELKKQLRLEGLRFGDIFPLLLTDNGGEFANISAFISDLNGEIETDLFFCDPYSSCQKPNVEKNHTLFRDIAPKGESFDGFTQETVNTIFSHVNSSKRKSLNGKSPYEVFVYFFNEEVASILGIRHIPAEDVVQDKRLLKSLRKTSSACMESGCSLA
jgi:IS30 family transposase